MSGGIGIKAKHVANTGMLLSLMIVLSIFESLIPPIPFLPPQMKLGLANIVSMYCVLFIGHKEAVGLTVAKSVFILLTRSFTAFALSISGGLCSIFFIILLRKLFKDKVSYLLLSVCGAIMHNFGQIAAYCVIMGTLDVLYYFPVLVISGVLMGTLTGTLLKVILPALTRIGR